MRILKWICGLALFFSLSATAQAVALNEPAPEFSLPLLEESGGARRLSDYRGKVVLLNFWASWCKPCQEELPALDALYRRYREGGLEIVGVNIDKNLKNARTFISRQPLSFPLLSDPEAAVIASFHARGMPSSFLIDREGTIRWVKFGFSKSQLGEFEDQIKAFLERSAHALSE